MKKFHLLSLFAVTILLHAGAPAYAESAGPIEEARAALKANDLAKAAGLLEPLTGADTKDALACHVLSQVRLAEKNPAAALALAEKAAALEPTKAEYFSQLGVAYAQRMGELPFMQQAVMAGKLRKAFAKAVELDPDNLAGLVGLTRFYYSAPEIAGGSLEKAQEFALRVQRLEPFLGEIELGNVASHDEKFAEALQHFETAAKLRPRQSAALYACGQALVKLDRKDEARARFLSALEIDPAFQPAKLALAALDAPKP